MIRVGLIGAGFIGRNHFNQYEKIVDRAGVVALCDKEAERRAGDWSKVGGNIADTQGTKRELGDIKPYSDYRQMLADPNIDLIDICAPTFLHRDMVTDALKAGKHVLCEKPMALTVEQCDEILAVAKKAKTRFMIAQVIRFWPEYVYLRKAYIEKRFGELKALHLRRQASTPAYSLNNWIVNPELSGGAILDLHVHDVDFALSLLGKPARIDAAGVPCHGKALDRIHALWRYDADLVVQLEGFWDMPSGYPFNMGFDAVFEKGSLVWNMASGKPLTLYRPNAEPETPEIPGDDGYFEEINYFVDCIENNRNPSITTPTESRDAVALALAEKTSAVTGKSVAIEF